MDAKQIEKAMRYVTLAEWMEGMQGQDGYYEVTLNCGHKMTCSKRFLTHSMMCRYCLAGMQSDA